MRHRLTLLWLGFVLLQPGCRVPRSSRHAPDPTPQLGSYSLDFHSPRDAQLQKRLERGGTTYVLLPETTKP